MILLVLRALSGCDADCADGAVRTDGQCVPDVSDRDPGTVPDTGDGPDTTTPPDTGDTADTGEAAPDLDGDGSPDAVDCDDDDPTVNPQAEELCDLLDNDCDGDIDESDAADATVWYADEDGDRYGDPSDVVTSCIGIFGYVETAGDCDDADDGVYPGALERCNDVDDDCDGAIDESDAVDADVWYLDADGDGYGDADGALPACTQPSGYVDVADDCDDGDAAVNPASPEIARDGVDNDCDGTSNGNGLDGERSLATADAVHYGADVGAYAGASLSAAGDLDGDGAADLVVGAPFAADAAPGAGTVYVTSLTTTGTQTLADAPVARYGLTAYDLAGFAVAALDLDGDGADDLVVGAPGDDTGPTDAGAVWWTSGPLTGEESLSGTQVPGDTANMGLGRVLAGGDVDGDGSDEVVAGAPLADGAGTDAGAVWLLDGDGTALATWDGEAAGDGAGSALAVGDLDGDGVADVVVGAPSADRDAGRVYVFDGGGAWAGSLASADVTLTGAAAGDGAGGGLGVADLDADGLGDILVGAPDTSDGAPLGGTLYVVAKPASGTLSSVAAAWFAGDEPGLHVGGAAAGGGDVDGDGAADLLVGAPDSDTSGLDAGEAFVLFGPFSGALAWDGRLEGEADYAYAGTAVSFAIDPFGDGFDDALVGAYGYERGGYAAGAVYRARGGSW